MRATHRRPPWGTATQAGASRCGEQAHADPTASLRLQEPGGRGRALRAIHLRDRTQWRRQIEPVRRDPVPACAGRPHADGGCRLGARSGQPDRGRTQPLSSRRRPLRRADGVHGGDDRAGEGGRRSGTGGHRQHTRRRTGGERSCVVSAVFPSHFGTIPIQPEFADLRLLPRPPGELSERIDRSIDLYPCDLLFVHRDAETESCTRREAEIHESWRASTQGHALPVITVVPVRMQEAWLLIDAAALRRVAGNPAGRQPLDMPDVARLEDLPDPKQLLHELLRDASGLHGRRLRHFKRDVGSRVHRLAEQIDDFSPLRELPAFRRVERQVAEYRQRGVPGLIDGLG